MSDATSFILKDPQEKDFWAKLRRVAGRIPFTADLLAAWYCAFDPVTPGRVRAILLGAIAYFILPTDTVPDFIAGFGFVDDATVLSMAIASVANNIRPEHRARAHAAVEKLKG